MFELRADQERVVNIINERFDKEKAVYNDSYPGTGKTIMTLWNIKHLRAKKIQIICPASVRDNWAREFVEADLEKPLVLYSSDKTPELSKKITGSVVCSYQLAARKLPFQKLVTHKPDLLVFDEAHYLAGETTGRVRMFEKLYKYADKVLFLSGTPYDSSADEMFPILNRVFPEKYPCIARFRARYCNQRSVNYVKRRKKK